MADMTDINAALTLVSGATTQGNLSPAAAENIRTWLTEPYLAEYAPQPPFDSGTPERATPRVHSLIGSMFDGLRDGVRETSQHALGGR